jgi:two-component system, response regulator FlrC
MAVPEREIALDAAPPPLLAADPVSRQVLELAQRVARADVTVTLTGESGVGKEVYARYIHAHSRRCQGPLIAINCAAIPETMLEATLFGHEKGAFTGAALAHSGKFEQADGGTLLLDEITEMAQGLQAKLLRVLQEREVERLGAASGRRVDVRVIAMSNRDLRQAVADGVLREDIYYRLNVFPIRIPPLRERPGDILPLAERLIERHGRGRQELPKLSSEAAARLREHRWPGNVRELDNVMQRALILQQGDSIEVDDLQIETAEPASALQADETSPLLASSLRVSEGELILDALKAENGQRKAAALRLGISPRTLRYKLARLREHGLAIP